MSEPDDGNGDIELGGSPGPRLAAQLFLHQSTGEGPYFEGTSTDDELESDLKVDREMLHRGEYGGGEVRSPVYTLCPETSE